MAVAALAAVDAAFVGFGLLLLFALNDDALVGAFHADVIFVEAGQFGGDFELIVTLAYFDCRRPHAGVAAAAETEGTGEGAIHLFAETAHHGKRTEAEEVAGVLLASGRAALLLVLTAGWLGGWTVGRCILEFCVCHEFLLHSYCGDAPRASSSCAKGPVCKRIPRPVRLQWKTW